MEADRDSWVVTGKKIIEEDQLRVLRESSEADPVRVCKELCFLSFHSLLKISCVLFQVDMIQMEKKLWMNLKTMNYFHVYPEIKHDYCFRYNLNFHIHS